jgi:hypothetical protein
VNTAAPPSPLLERVLIANVVVHAAAMATMLLFLVPVLPGGTTVEDAARMARIAAHPMLFRIGWFPWQLTALADLILAAAIVRARWIPRGPAYVQLLLTIAAVIPDQAAQIMFCGPGIAIARSGDLAAWLAFERRWFPLTSAWAACLYTAAAIAWSVGFARAGTWSRALTWLSIVTYGIFAVVSAGILLPPPYRIPQVVVSIGNAIAFVLFELWGLAVLHHVLLRSRPHVPSGRFAPFRAPTRGLGITDALANDRALHAFLGAAPRLAFLSDIHDVVYVNYLVPAACLERFVPEGLELQRLGDGAWAIFTHLTYRHGNFGPRLLGPLRRLMSSPVQSNWRIHVRDPRTGVAGITFVTVAIDATLTALVARAMSDGVPMHVLHSASLRRDDDGVIEVRLDPGEGSAPDLQATLRPGSKTLPPPPSPWTKVFADWEAMLAYVVPQDRAMTTEPWRGTVTRQEIDLGIPLEACEPLEGEVRSRAVESMLGVSIAEDARPVCFRVPRVQFVFEGEVRDRLVASDARREA